MGVSSRGCCGVIVAAAAFCIVQSILWLGLSVVGILLRNCSVKPDFLDPSFIIVIVYFYNKECAVWAEDILETPATTKRTDIITWYFLVTSVLRVVASVALLVKLVAAQRRGRGVSGAGLFFLVWLVLVVACLCGDVVCAIVYGVDLGHVESLSDLLGFPVSVTEPEGAKFWGLSALPLVMLFFCLRLGVLWIPEAVMVGMAAKVFWKDRKEMKWLFGGNSTNTLASTSQSSVTVPWMESDGVAGDWGGGGGGGGAQGGRDAWGGGGADVVRRTPPAEYHEPTTLGVHEASYSVPADSTQGWGGAYPRDPNRRSGSDRGGDRGGLRRPNVPPPLHLRAEEGGPPSPNRLGPWDPRSPFPPPGATQAQHPFFGMQPTHSAFRPPPPAEDPPAPPVELGPDGERRYKLKLKDHETELRRREEAREAQEAQRRRLQEQMLEEEDRRLRDLALQEVSQKAEERRRRRAEVEVEAAVRAARPRPVPPPKPPTRATAGLQHQKPWSYVLPPRDDMPGRRMSPATRGGGGGADDDDDELAPPVPVPDYTLHFNRPSDRPALGNR